MTNFNPKGKERDIEQWETIAENKAAKTGASTKLIAGILAGGLGVSFGVIPLGGVAAAFLIKSAWDSLEKSGKRLRIVRDTGCNAFVLDEDDFRDYAQQFGAETVKAELEFALEAGCKLTNFAQNWLDANQRLQVPAIAPAPVNRPLVAASVGASVGARLESNYNLATTQTVVDSGVPGGNFDLIEQMTTGINNLFIVGVGGCGKGMILANGLRAVKAKYPGKKIFLINGKDSKKELGYFDGIVDVHKVLHCESTKPGTVAAWFEACVEEFDEFAQVNNGALLVIDEGTIIGARLKVAKCTALNDRILGITSCGGEASKNIWFVAQTPFVGANGGDLASIGQLTPVCIVTKAKQSVLDVWKRATIFRDFNQDEIVDLIEASECERAVYYGGNTTWYSMPKLTNHCRYDRDSHTYLPGFEPQDSKSEVPKEWETLRDFLRKYPDTDITNALKQYDSEIDDTCVDAAINMVAVSAQKYGDNDVLSKFSL